MVNTKTTGFQQQRTLNRLKSNAFSFIGLFMFILNWNSSCCFSSNGIFEDVNRLAGLNTCLRMYIVCINQNVGDEMSQN